MGTDDTNVTPANPGDTSGNKQPDTTQPAAPKVELKDGKTFLDGREVVPVADLIGAKRGWEGEKVELQQRHEQMLAETKQSLSNAQDQVAQLTAKVQEAENAGVAGATTDAEVAKLKADLDLANKSTEDARNALLDIKRTNLQSQYKIPEEQLKDKNMDQLDALEVALKTVRVPGGVGNYAIGGGMGGTTPMSAEERAQQVLNNTPVRGVRNAQAS